MSGELIGPQGGSVWLNRVPQGMYETLQWVSARYGRPTILITENGCDMLGEDEPRSFNASLFSFHGRGDVPAAAAQDGPDRSVSSAGSGGDDHEQSLESMLLSESESTKSLLMDDFRQVTETSTDLYSGYSSSNFTTI